MVGKIFLVLLILASAAAGWSYYAHHRAGAFGDGAVFATPGAAAQEDAAVGDDAAAAGPSPADTASRSETASQALPSGSPSTEFPVRETPAGDTLASISATGPGFAGATKFQWYREGNLTWRLNTENGAACVAFATLEEWRKPIVYGHGCSKA